MRSIASLAHYDEVQRNAKREKQGLYRASTSLVVT
jgi:hypothetical protein